eukprot:c18057_g1_i1 orf=487-726(-)
MDPLPLLGYMRGVREAAEICINRPVYTTMKGGEATAIDDGKDHQQGKNCQTSKPIQSCIKFPPQTIFENLTFKSYHDYC